MCYIIVTLVYFKIFKLTVLSRFLHSRQKIVLMCIVYLFLPTPDITPFCKIFVPKFAHIKKNLSMGYDHLCAT